MDEPGAVDLTAVRLLHQVIARLNSQPTLAATLQAIVDGVVAGAGFAVAALYFRLPDGSFQALAVAGPHDARAAVLRQCLPPDAFDLDFARAQAWGTLRFVSHDRFVPEMVTHWVPPTASDAESALEPAAEVWHPLDALFVPLHAATGRLVGVLSVDCPDDGRRPSVFRRTSLELFAAHAGIALDNARLTQELHDEHRRLQLSEEAFRLTFEGSQMPMAMLSLQPGQLSRYLRVNQAMCHLTGFSAAELLTRRAVDIIHPDYLAADMAAAVEAQTGLRDSYQAEKRYVRADGTTVWVAVTTTVVGRSSDHAPHAISLVEDITARRAAEAELAHRAAHDPLTGLVNRYELDRRITQALHRVRRTGRTGAVLFCDLDGFKAINDQLGHQRGDLVLVEVARRLTAEVRLVDTVARVGGDEFVVLAEDLRADGVTSLTARLAQSVAQPLPGTAGRALTLSVGVARITGHSADPDTLLREADSAMYAAKAHNRNPPTGDPMTDLSGPPT